MKIMSKTEKRFLNSYSFNTDISCTIQIVHAILRGILFRTFSISEEFLRRFI